MPALFIGSYKVMLDAKNRFNIPAPFKKVFDSLEDGGQSITLRRAVNAKDNINILQIFPSSLFNKRIEFLLRDSDPCDPEAEEKRRFILANSFPSEIKHNRVLVPQTSMEHSQLASKIWVVGMGEYFEIWNFDEGNKRFKDVG